MRIVRNTHLQHKIHFVMQRSQQINTYFSDDLIERKIVSDFIFQKEDLFAELNLSFDELKIFKEVKSKFYDSYLSLIF